MQGPRGHEGLALAPCRPAERSAEQRTQQAAVRVRSSPGSGLTFSAIRALTPSAVTSLGASLAASLDFFSCRSRREKADRQADHGAPHASHPAWLLCWALLRPAVLCPGIWRSSEAARAPKASSQPRPNNLAPCGKACPTLLALRRLLRILAREAYGSRKPSSSSIMRLEAGCRVERHGDGGGDDTGATGLAAARHSLQELWPAQTGQDGTEGIAALFRQEGYTPARKQALWPQGCSNHIMQPASSGAGGEHQQRATEQGVARGAQPATMAAPTGPCLSTSSRKVAEKLASASLMGLGSTRLVFLPPSSPPSAGPAVAGAGGGAGCLQATSRTAWIAADTSAGISYGAAEQCGAVQQPRVGPMTVRGAPGPRGGGSRACGARKAPHRTNSCNVASRQSERRNSFSTPLFFAEGDSAA